MAAPSVATTNTTNITISASTHTINMPASIGAGDLLIILGRTGNTATHNLPSGGWAWLLQNDVSDASDDATSVIWKQAAGSDTLDWTTSAVCKAGYIAWRITGGRTGEAPIISSVGVGTTATLDPPAPSLPASDDYLFIAFSTMDGETQLVSTWPTNYASNQLQANSGTGGAPATNCRVAAATRTATTSTEDPAAYTWDAIPNAGGNAATIAVRQFVPQSLPRQPSGRRILIPQLDFDPWGGGWA